MVPAREKDADTEKNTPILQPRTQPWPFFLLSLILVLLSTLLALLAVLAFSSARQVVHQNSMPAPPSHAIQLSEFCPHPALRREWRTLSNTQKSEYLSAVQCLQRLPGISGLPGARTRFDDFQALHVALAEEVHLVGHFLPWHRRFLNVYESALREECKFQGFIPYWDWSQDVDNGVPLAQSPVFDAVYGFGGNGLDVPEYAGQFGNLSILASVGWVPPEGGGGCVVDGPFASYNLSLGPGTEVTNHCLQRALNDELRWYISGTRVADVARQETFEAFRIELEGAPVTDSMRLHDGGHNAIGGEMADRYSSPGDPIFYLHHAFLDKLWWQWEMVDPMKRLGDMSGRSTVDPPHVNVTLDFELKMMKLAPTVTIREVMDIRNELLCYAYA